MINSFKKNILFNCPYLTGQEIEYVKHACSLAKLSGDGVFTKKCQKWLEEKLKVKKAFLTHSCTSALDMVAILAGIKEGDEIIMPSYTFVSTANAFVLRGAKPVFVDIRPDTLNLNEKKIENRITRKTRAIVPVHYAGVGCEMDAILAIAKKHKLLVIEDAAHCVHATYKGKELGSMGDFGVLSFHETKNIISGEGGAVLVNNKRFIKRAEVIWQKGTDRSRFQRGEVDKYTWRDIGSSFLPGEVTAAFLFAQLEKANEITNKRLSIWNQYHDKLEHAERENLLRRPIIPHNCQHNAHLYYILLKKNKQRNFIQKMRDANIGAVFHYIPLHSSPFISKRSSNGIRLPQTDKAASSIVRLPLWIGMEKHVPAICKIVVDILKNS